MTMTKQEKLLNELKKMTGLKLSIQNESNENSEDIIRALSDLCESFRRSNNCETLLCRLINGTCDKNEFIASSSHLRMNMEKKRILYLIELDPQYVSAALKLIRQLFSNRIDAFFIPYEEEQLIVIDSAEKAKPGDFYQTASNILSMLNTELYAAAHISYSLAADNILSAKEAYEQAAYAMKVGKLFQPDQVIHSYGNLDAGRLMSDISEKTAQEFICEITGKLSSEDILRVFRDEFSLTADCFLKNNLNIAETARQLHVHRNTLLYRLEMIQNETSLDIRRFDDAMKYKLISLCLLLLNSQKN